ncbi:MAG: HNH endonuclease [Chloroflexi bacterium]|nr:HNH endonuclease [Chloroflexota bacterium]
MSRIRASLRQAVVEAARGLCAYCRSPESFMGIPFEVDHVIPRSAGGRATLDNLCVSCPTCNRHKASRVTAPDPASGRAAPLYHPNRDQWADHFAWSDDGIRIIGLTPTGRATAEALRFNRPAMITLRRYWMVTGIRPAE